MSCCSRVWQKLKSIEWTNLDCFEKRLSRFFEFYSGFVFRHPWPFILIPIILTVGLGVGFFYKHEMSDATYLYTPTGALSKFEKKCISDKWPLVDGVYIPGKAVDSVREAQSIVTARDGGSVLRPEIGEAISRLNVFITDKIKVTLRNVTYTYHDLCMRWQDTCYSNGHVSLVSNVFSNCDADPSLCNITYLNMDVRLTYPMAVFGTDRGYLGSSLGGAIVDPTTGLIKQARAWFLLYQLRYNDTSDNEASSLWELEFQKRLLDYSDPFLRITVFHSQTLGLELRRNAEKLAPRFAICFVILVLFAMLVTFAFIDDSRFPYIDWVISKPLLAFLGVLGAGMGILTSIGLMAFCGYVYNQIVSVMPFLIIAVRLDNTFIMISALRHVSRTLPAEKRMTTAMSEAASAITVTVTTDFFSFLTGVSADIPAVQIFCVYTAVAVLITFFYQLTFLMGILALATKNEEKGQNAMFLCVQTVTPKEAKERGLFTRLFNQGTRVEVRQDVLPVKGNEKDEIHASPGTMSRFFADYYSPILMHPIIRTMVLVWFVLYVGVSAYLCTQMRQGLEPIKLLVADSYAIPHYHLMEQIFWRNGTEMQIVVNNAPNLANKTERQRLKNMTKAFCDTPHSMSSSSVQFWLQDFEEYLRSYYAGMTRLITDDVDVDTYYNALDRFFSLSTYEKLGQDVIWGNVTLPDTNQTRWMITSFRLSMGLSNFQTAVLQIETVNLMRKVANDLQWSYMNVTTFNTVWLFVDQYQEILPNVIQEVAGGVGVMILIALLLIPHPFISFWVAITILSVDLGVVGFMTLWDINLDTISMLTIIMSIGFSVDFAAHVAHAFVVSSDKDALLADKVKTAMGEVGWPIIQGALSTLLGVIVLANLDSYMVVAFLKTVVLVIVFAVIHGLVFLPVLLSVFVPRKCGGGKKVENEKNVKNSSHTATVYPEINVTEKLRPQIANLDLNMNSNGHVVNGGLEKSREQIKGRQAKVITDSEV